MIYANLKKKKREEEEGKKERIELKLLGMRRKGRKGRIGGLVR